MDCSHCAVPGPSPPQQGPADGPGAPSYLGLTGSSVPVEQLASLLNHAIGRDGTRLDAVTQAYHDGENVVIETQDTVCSAGETQGSDCKCTRWVPWKP